MSKFFGGLGHFAVRFRWVVIAVWIAGAVAATAFLPSLSSVINNNNQSFLPASAPSERAAVLAAPLLGSGSAQTVIVVASNGDGKVLTAADLAAVQRETVAASHAVHSLGAHFVGLSKNGKAAQVVVRADVSGDSETPATQLVDALRASFATVGAPPGLVFHTAGPVAVAVDLNRQAGSNGSQTQLLSLVFIVLLLLVIFRSFLAPLATLLPAALVLQIAEPVVAGVAHTGVKVSSVAQLLLIVLVLGAGTDYGLFLVFRVREEMRRGLPHREAVEVALRRVGESITFSAATVIAALLSLLFATFGIYHDLGIPLAIGIGLMLLAGLTLLPALLAVLGRGLFWPTKNKAGARTTGTWGEVAGRIVKRSALTLVVGLVVFGGLAIAATGNRPSGFGGATAPPKGSDSALGDAVLAANFPAASANPTNLVLRFATPIWTDPGQIAPAERTLDASRLFTGLVGPLNPAGVPLSPTTLVHLHAVLGPPGRLPAVPLAGTAGARIPLPLYQAYRAEAQLVSADGHTMQFEASLAAGNPSQTAAINAVPAIRAALGRAAVAAHATNSGVAGEAPALYDVNATSNADLFRIVPIAVLVIGLLLALLLRSLVAPFYLIASVGLSYLAALGLSVIVFMDLGGASGLTFILPFLMFIFLLALGEDYNILVMSRIREEAAHMPLREAVTKAIGVTGTTVTSAGMVLAGTFLVFAVAGSAGPGGSQIRDIGFGLAFGIILDTFFVRTVLVPSTVVLLGRWNWWPSRLRQDTPGEPDGGTAERVVDSGEQLVPTPGR